MNTGRNLVTLKRWAIFPTDSEVVNPESKNSFGLELQGAEAKRGKNDFVE